MKIVYLGTPYFAGNFLEKIVTDVPSVEICAVVTQPDQPVGRKKELTPSPVKITALKNEIPVFHSLEAVSQAKPDLAVLFAYGEIIPESILAIPKYGFWNIHPSLLPLYRGASPITYPLFLNDAVSGVSLMQMDRDLDHGPIIAQKEYNLKETDTRAFLEKHFTEMAFQLFKNSLLHLQANNHVPCQPQIHDKATFTRPLTRDDGYIPLLLLQQALKGENHDLSTAPAILTEFLSKHSLTETFDSRYKSAAELLWSFYRAFDGWPGVWTTAKISGKILRIKLLEFSFNGNDISLDLVQLEGKTPVDFATFQSAYSLF